LTGDNSDNTYVNEEGGEGGSEGRKDDQLSVEETLLSFFCRGTFASLLSPLPVHPHHELLSISLCPCSNLLSLTSISLIACPFLVKQAGLDWEF